MHRCSTKINSSARKATKESAVLSKRLRIMEIIFLGEVMVAVCLILLSFLWILLLRSNAKVPKGAPPGSFGWPFLGETLAFLRARRKSSAYAFFTEKRKRYGQTFRTHLFFSPTVVIAGVDAHKLLQTDGYRSFTGSEMWSMRELFGSSCLLFKEGERHRRLRSAIIGSMTSKVLEAQIPRLQKLSIETLESWKGLEVLASQELAKFTFYSICGLLLSLMSSPRGEYLRRNFEVLAKNVAALPLKLPGSSYNKALEARRVLVDEMKEMIKDRKKKANGVEVEDFLDKVTRPSPDSEGLQPSDEEIIDNVIFFIFAGYETTTTALCKIIQLLTDHPHELDLVKAEQKKVVQEIGDGGSLTLETLKSMKYTTMVINEALRLSHLGSEILIRTAKTDIDFSGYTIPKGWNVIIDKAFTNMNPHIYEDPSKFKPARFQAHLPLYAFTPFGAGTRMCAGMEFANLEMLVFVHHLVNSYRWRLTRDDNDKLEYTGVVQKPKNGLPIILQSNFIGKG